MLPRRRIVRAFSLVAFGLLFCGHAWAQTEKLELRLRLKQGEVYRLRTTIDQRINQGGGANPQATEQTFAVVYSMTVEGVDAAGNMNVATKYEAVLFRQKGPAGAVEYDSANPPKQVPQAARPFAALAGLGFRSTITPAGRVTGVQGLEAMFSELVRKLDLPEGPARAAAQKALAAQFGEEAMKQNLQNLFGLFPDAPVDVGQSWRRRVAIDKGVPFVIDGTHTLKSRAGGVARIEVKATLTPNDDAAPVDLGTGKMSYELKGEQTGTAEVDEATGWTRKMTTTQQLGGTLRFQGAGGAPEVNSPVTIEEQVVMEEMK